MRDVCAGFGAELTEFNGERGHPHPLVHDRRRGRGGPPRRAPGRAHSHIVHRRLAQVVLAADRGAGPPPPGTDLPV